MMMMQKITYPTYSLTLPKISSVRRKTVLSMWNVTFDQESKVLSKVDASAKNPQYTAVTTTGIVMIELKSQR